MDKYELINRTKKFSVRVYKIADKLPPTPGAKNVNYQLMKSSSSVAANYRAACRAKSKADFINKLKIVEEEADESQYWLEYMIDVDLLIDINEQKALIKEASELVAIFTSSLRTLRAA
ncbi:MAG TPA: four helix bundle protein [Bacteroidia bacterium]|jgi:four helix bundle protein|nr:four helix bundle protein [Bacteroidia bacterium]